MGKQIGIFMNQLDEDEFFREVTICRGAAICEPRPLTVKDLSIASLPPIVTKPPRNLTYYIRPCLIDPEVHYLESMSGKKIIDSSESSVVELFRSHVLDGVCYPGRLWYEPKLSDGSEKPTVFREWAEALFSWIRAHYALRQQGAISYYIGPYALTAEGAKLLTLG